MDCTTSTDLGILDLGIYLQCIFSYSIQLMAVFAEQTEVLNASKSGCVQWHCS